MPFGANTSKFFPFLTAWLCLQTAQMPRCRDLAIFVPTDDRQNRLLYPCACAWSNECVCFWLPFFCTHQTVSRLGAILYIVPAIGLMLLQASLRFGWTILIVLTMTLA